MSDLKSDKVCIPLEGLADWAIKGQLTEFRIAEYERDPECADFVAAEVMVNLRDVSAFKVEVLTLVNDKYLLAAKVDVDGFITRQHQVTEAKGRDVILG
ncbi:hypothetical protein AB395_00002880 [Sinorhizobium fredii CCBAU 45436]|nr:hypothetical protein AB395_00002880 [Sinorhizobium fredii CCBAU 45436]